MREGRRVALVINVVQELPPNWVLSSLTRVALACKKLASSQYVLEGLHEQACQGQ